VREPSTEEVRAITTTLGIDRLILPTERLDKQTRRFGGELQQIAEKAIQLYTASDEVTMDDVAARLGITKHSVSRYLKAHGVPARPGGQRRKPMPAARPCKHCSAEFVPSRVQVKRGNGEFCTHECKTNFRWADRYNPDMHLEPFVRTTNWSPRSKKRVLGGVHGHKGAAAGRAKGGRPPESTPEQRQHMLQLDKEGLSTREIAERVFGNRKLHLRVYRFLNG
jgi:hypothetical protein